MHDDEHGHRRRQVVQIGREYKGGQRNGPQQTLGVPRAYPFLDEVETAIVVQQLHDRHGSQQEHDNSGSLADVVQKDMAVDVVLDGLAGRRCAVEPCTIIVRMPGHDEVRAPADVDHPPHRSEEHGDGGLVNACQVTCGYQHIGQYQHRNDYQCHSFSDLITSIF